MAMWLYSYGMVLLYVVVIHGHGNSFSEKMPLTTVKHAVNTAGGFVNGIPGRFCSHLARRGGRECVCGHRRLTIWLELLADHRRSYTYVQS